MCPFLREWQGLGRPDTKAGARPGGAVGEHSLRKAEDTSTGRFRTEEQCQPLCWGGVPASAQASPPPGS